MPTPKGLSLERLAFGDGSFVAVAGRNRKGILVSTIDGRSWHWHWVDATRHFLDVAYGDGTWILTGTEGAVLQSLTPGGVGSIERTNDGDYQLALFGSVGREYDLLLSDDLYSWRHLETFTISDPQGYLFHDGNHAESRKRFYRVKAR